jgi:hypothetical protein
VIVIAIALLEEIEVGVTIEIENAEEAVVAIEDQVVMIQGTEIEDQVVMIQGIEIEDQVVMIQEKIGMIQQIERIITVVRT